MKEKIAELLMFYGEQANDLEEKIKELGLKEDTLVVGGVYVFDDSDETVAQGCNFYVEDEDELDFTLAMLRHSYGKNAVEYPDFLGMINGDDEKE
jgi:methylmalonyl-CoA mutase cobalamin-binding subunit